MFNIIYIYIYNYVKMSTLNHKFLTNKYDILYIYYNLIKLKTNKIFNFQNIQNSFVYVNEHFIIILSNKIIYNKF